MLTKTILYFVLNLVINFVALGDGFLISMNPEQAVQTFKSIVRSKYMRNLANEFATKAADYLITEMQNKEEEIIEVDYRSPTHMDNFRNNNQDLSVLDEREALTLLQAPSPDGDNLEIDEAYLSDDESEQKAKTGIPVVGVMKVNGVYFRRILGVI